MESSTVTKSTTGAKAPAVKVPVPEESFRLAAEIERLLGGRSNKSVSQILNMVASVHGLRVIPVDRPIGQVNRPTETIVSDKKEKKVAAYKQTTQFKEMSLARQGIVDKIKLAQEGPVKEGLRTELRTIERKLKDLKSPVVGN